MNLERSLENHSSYGLFSARGFMAEHWPERLPLLEPWLLSSSLNMLYAAAGVGKSNFALGLALALARGEPFLGFTPREPVRVLYVDGEMPAQELQRRLLAMANGVVLPDNLFFLNKSAAHKDCRLPSLSTAEGREMLEQRMNEIAPQLLILDNKSTLMSNARENEAGSFDAIQEWLIEQRGMGIAVLLLHHAGKNGTQRGSSQHDVTPDITLELYEPEGLPPVNGSQFVVRFEKHRHLPPSKVPELLVKLEMNTTRARWSYEPYKGGRKIDPRRAQAIALLSEGKSQNEVARIVGASPSTVNGWAKKQAIRDSVPLESPNGEYPLDEESEAA